MRAFGNLDVSINAALSSSRYTQADRPLRVTTDLEEDELLLQRISGTEEVSAPFRFTLWMLSTNPAIEAAKMLGTPMTVTIRLADGAERELSGLVSRFTQLERADDLTSYRAEIVPWLWFLALSTDCRIFQKKSVKEIIEIVFRDTGYSDFDWKCGKDYPKREYCVQYRETHLDFVSRLMEEEGIFYLFTHQGGKHRLLITDDPKRAPLVPGPRGVRMTPTSGTAVLDEDTVLSWEHQYEYRTGKYAMRDYNFETPATTLEGSLANDHKEEIFDYPGKFAARDEGARYARLRLEAHESEEVTATGSSDCRHLVAGHRFDLEEHDGPGVNGTYLLLEVHHEATNSDVRARGGGVFEYRNSFRVVPESTPYHPPLRTPKPRVYGSQTAVVVGPPGEEIYTDRYSRVKVQFHWDRQGKKNELSSCWIRVATTWAGKQWGSIHIPRIGQEVIVGFLEGDPDLPIITGSVYNAAQMPPYALPDRGTQSGTKSASSKGGGGSNELRFEDKKGEEEIYIHAQKDRLMEVENDNAEDVGRDETITVGRDQRITIEKNRTESVGADESISITKNRSEKVGENETVAIGKNRSHTVGKDESVDVSGKRDITVTKEESLTVGDKRSVKIGKDDNLDVGKKLVITAGDEIAIRTGSSSIVMKKNGEITIKGKDIKLEGSGKINVKASSDVVIKGSKIMQN